MTEQIPAGATITSATALEDAADIALDKIEELQDDMANAEDDLQHARDQISDIDQAIREILEDCAGILRG